MNSQSVNHTHTKRPDPTTLALEPPMTPDWNTIRLDLLQIDEPMRATLREMRPFFATSMPGILARFYDKVRHSDPSSGIFRDGPMLDAVVLQPHPCALSPA